MAHVLEAQYNWPVPAGTTLDRTSAGWDSWIFAQYLNDSIQLFLEGSLLETPPGCFLIVRPNTGPAIPAACRSGITGRIWTATWMRY